MKVLHIPPVLYHLEFTAEELQFLSDITYLIGGDFRHSRRKISDQWQNTLRELGFEYREPKDLSLKHRAIYFDDEE